MPAFFQKAMLVGVVSCSGTPTRPTAPPGRAISIAVTTACSRPTHSSTECAPDPPVNSRTRSTASSPRSPTTSVAPNSCPTAVRSGFFPSRMICSAPSRFAAITPQRPTGPSPTTATELPGATLAATAGGWPGPITPASVRSEGMRGGAGALHVAERQQRGHECVVLADRQCGERAVCLGDAHGFALAAVDVVGAVAAAVQALALQSLAAEDAGAVRPQEGRDDEVAHVDRLHVDADGFDDADELVAHP